MTTGEREPISLSKEKVKWVLPPGVHASEEAASESESEAEEGEGANAGRPHHGPGRPGTRGRCRKHGISPGPDDGLRPRKTMRMEVRNAVLSDLLSHGFASWSIRG